MGSGVQVSFSIKILIRMAHAGIPCSAHFFSFLLNSKKSQSGQTGWWVLSVVSAVFAVEHVWMYCFHFIWLSRFFGTSYKWTIAYIIMCVSVYLVYAFLTFQPSTFWLILITSKDSRASCVIIIAIIAIAVQLTLLFLDCCLLSLQY